MVLSAQDIVEEQQIKGIKNIKSIISIKGLTKEEQKIVKALQDQSLHFDELVKRTGLPSSQRGIE